MKIEKLEISTSRLNQQKKFYQQIMGLEILNEDSKTFEVRLGFSTIKLIQTENATPYHIAIHIPDKQEEKALEWLTSRVNILKAGNDEIIDFSNWKAKSIYFYDEDLNIMELISRRDFFKVGSSGFSSKDFLGIAEIGLATNNISEKFQFLKDHCKLEIFDGNLEKFCAIGDDEGLFITINKSLKDWFPTDDKAFGSNFRIEFNNKGSKYELEFINDDLRHV